MKLNGPQSERLSEALRDAFTPQALARVLAYKLSLRLSDFTSYGNGGDAQQVAFELLREANSNEWVDQLLLAARAAAPGNSLLYGVAQQFGLGAARASHQVLERIVVSTNGMLEPNLFRARLGALEPRVCRIEYTLDGHSVFGTGFLVAPDLIMTNHHVIAPLVGTATPAAARFDYRQVYDGAGTLVRTDDGRLCRFNAEWLIEASPAEELDFALVRLAEAAGEDNLDGGAQGAPLRRGFIELPTATLDDAALALKFAAGSSLFILQHPSGQPLKLAMDTQSVLGLFDSGTRVRYTTNTEAGSSGAPCFSPAWELLALHHSGDPNFDPAHKPSYNEGIPLHRIRRLLEQRGQAGVLGAAKD